MPRVRIITDSSAHFRDPDFPARHNVTVVPLTIQFGDQSFREGIDLNGRGFLERTLIGSSLPTAVPPSVEQFGAVYAELGRTADQILSIHVSSKLSRTWRHAKNAADALLGRKTVVAIDSLTISVGLGWVVEAAVRAVESGESLEEAVRVVRGMLSRMYAVFFVESLSFLEKVGRLGPAQVILGSMLGVKPFLTMEEGDLVPMEKVRSRAQAVEKLSEFVAEFANVERLAILQLSPSLREDTRQLLERLAVDFRGRKFDVLPYGPSLGAFIGPDSLGVMVLEGREE